MAIALAVAVVALIVAFGVPKPLVAGAGLVAVLSGIVALLRREPWWGASVLVIFLSLWAVGAANRPPSIEPEPSAEAAVVEPIADDSAMVSVTDSNWSIDSGFAGRGAIIWNVKVENGSARNVAAVEVEFTTYDKDGAMVATDSTYVTAIPAGESRAEKAYADLYHTEETAEFKIKRVRFAPQ